MNDPLRLARTDRVLVLAPHPDDETLATGGLLQRALAAGAGIRVLFVTDGEDNPWAQRATEHRWAIGPADRERWGERRRAEAVAALECLGVSRWQTGFLGYPDQGIHRLLLDGDDDLVETLTGEITRFDPTLLVAPSLADLHPDHSALAVFVRLALSRLAADRRPRERQFVVHHDGPLPAAARDAVLALTPRERERKRLAILCHASQLRLRRRALLAFADAQELFLAPAAPGEHDARHPVRHASVDGDVALLLELARRGRPGAFGATDLWLLLERPGRRLALAGRLPRRAGPVELFERGGGALVARGEMRPRERGLPDRVTLPASLLSGWTQAYVKLERRFGFFDEAGWRALPCRAAVGETPERPVPYSIPLRAREAAAARPARRDRW